jgi:hypothetical protein
MKLRLLATAMFFVSITHAQNVGIGTTTPTQKLDVRGKTTDDSVLISVGNADASHQLGLYGGRLNDPNPFIIWKAGDPLRFVTDFNGFTELVRIMPNGNMGIGTISPDLAKLQVQGMVGNTVAMFSDIATSTGVSLVADYPGIFFNSYWNNGLRSMSASGYSSFIETDQTTGDFTFNVAAVANTTANGLITVPERMRITRSGNVGIGTDAPDASALLDLSATTQGFLPPRLSQTQIDALHPVAGLQVFNTTTLKPNYNDGTQWRNFDGKIAFRVGESAYGGVVAYILHSGDIGYDPYVRHGLIAVTSDLSGDAEWGCTGTSIPGAISDYIGIGNQNTTNIVNGCSTPGIAAGKCFNLELNGYSDWYLPSIEELRQLFLNRDLIGAFNAGANYWSSTEVIANSANAMSFSFGTMLTSNKSSRLLVRPVRSF